MSSPHTGKLTATIQGHSCSFDGNLWIAPDPSLAEILNYATETTAKRHVDIRELAEIILRKTELWSESAINEVERDEWKGVLPPDALE